MSEEWLIWSKPHLLDDLGCLLEELFGEKFKDVTSEKSGSFEMKLQLLLQ
jgi:hypothetical protein